MVRIRSGGRRRQQVRVGAPDRSLTANAGLAAITELCDRLGVVKALDQAAGPIKQRNRGAGAGELLTGIAAAQLAGEDFLTGLARRITPAQWRAVESGLAAITSRMLPLLPAPRAAALADGPVTIDLDTTDVEVYGSKKRGVAYNHQGHRQLRGESRTYPQLPCPLGRSFGRSGPGTTSCAAGRCSPMTSCAGRQARRGRTRK